MSLFYTKGTSTTNHHVVSQIHAMTKVLLGSVSDSTGSISKVHNISHPITNHYCFTKGRFPQLTKVVCVSNHNHLRPVTLPPALASATMHGLLPSPSSGKLLIPLPNEWCHQALHVRQLLGGTSQLQSPLTDSLHNLDCICLSIEPFKFCVDTGQVVIQFAVVRNIHSNAPVL